MILITFKYYIFRFYPKSQVIYYVHNLFEFNRFVLINVKETSYSKNVHGLVDRH